MILSFFTGQQYRKMYILVYAPQYWRNHHSLSLPSAIAHYLQELDLMSLE